MQPPSANPGKGSSAASGGSGGGHMSARQLLRQQRELDEKRKFGLAPLAVDTLTQQEISPNVPQSIAQAPWYYGVSGPTLEHQRNRHIERDGLLTPEIEKVKVIGKATTFVAGACKNCGSRTHKTRECVHSKKKVGAVFTGKVTGVDVVVAPTLSSSSVGGGVPHKRDRLVGNVGVDLLKGAIDVHGNKTIGDGLQDDPDKKKLRPEGVFTALSARHGGGAIAALPKYLQNLNAQDDNCFFDPKTGSMRGNPNAADPTRVFQGDLERYRSDEFYDYVESQHRYLTGQSKGFVDFDYDAEMRKRKTGATASGEKDVGGRVTAQEQDSPQAALLRSLYGVASSHTSASTTDATTATMSGTKASTDGNEHAASAQSSALGTPAVANVGRDDLEEATRWLTQGATHNGHTHAYGSFFDLTTFAWGYKCCRALGKDAPSCSGGDT